MEIRFFRTENFRLTASFVVLFAAALIALTGVLYVIADNAFKTEILINARADLAAIRKGYQAEGISEASEVVSQQLAQPTSSGFLILQDREGKKIAGNLPAMTPVTGTKRLPVPRIENGAGAGSGHEILGEGEMIAPGLYAFAGADLFVLHAAETQALHAIGWALVVTIALAMGGGFLLSRGFLRRMDAITRTCQAIMAGRLADRIPDPGTHDELGRLASVINAMLDRINGLMLNVQQISNDIAHDLRTPLTRLRHHLELMRSEGMTHETYISDIDRAIENTDQILATFSALLRLGQIEAGTLRRSFQAVDLKELVSNLIDIYHATAEDTGHVLITSISGTATISGDRELLSNLVANLIENAIAHTPSGTDIAVSLQSADGAVSLCVADRGLGIPPAEYNKVFERFYRLDQSRSSPGSGLGLPLVAAIVQLHHGTITLSNNRPGLRVTVTFPQLRC